MSATFSTLRAALLTMTIFALALTLSAVGCCVTGATTGPLERPKFQHLKYIPYGDPEDPRAHVMVPMPISAGLTNGEYDELAGIWGLVLRYEARSEN